MPLADTTADFLRPLSVQKGRHFAEKFATEDATTFWYHDEKAIVSACSEATLHHMVLYMASTYGIGGFFGR